jgi:predicted nuclease of predicted toxin-antitoxin system
MTGVSLRLLIDHNVGRGVAAALHRSGYDVAFADDVDPHLSDVAILRWAVEEQRVIVTQDHDFGALVYRSGQPHAGVLLLRMPSSTRDERLQTLLWILENHASSLQGRFSVFENDRLRIR